ncbi:MAG: serine/threonine protein kinase [Deltaproteobacteria bacterium]|jgi:serine/threonine protein kinase|nr:serine/threonine protein kinase [Deltaproteobacteria bacterium]
MTAAPDTDDRQPSSTDPGASDRRSGELIAGRYRLIERIGEGAMGTVYLARHEGLQRQVAVKFLQEEFTGNREIAARFAREAIAAARLQHPNVISVYDSGADELGRCYLVMEYVGAESLRTVMEREGAIPRERALSLARQIAAALDHAHSLGIVHRDIKPENVLVLDVEGVECVKVIDFGIAKVFHPEGPSGPGLTRSGIVLGTPEYMAPEQAAGAEVDQRADIYALGVIAYEMLVGRRPFESDDVMSLLMAHLNATPPPPSTVRPDLGFGPEVDEALARALAKSPAARPQRAAELVEQLDAALHAPVVVKTPTVPVPPDEPATEPVPPDEPATEPAKTEASKTGAGGRSPALRAWAGLSKSGRILLSAAALALAGGALSLGLRGDPDEAGGRPTLTALPRSPTPVNPEGTGPAEDDDLDDRIDALRDGPEFTVATARQRQAAARSLEALRARSPNDAALAFVLGSIYARDRSTHAQALGSYGDALRLAPGLGARAALVDDVVRIFAASSAHSAAAGELLRGPLAARALDPLVEVLLRGGSGRSRVAALLGEAPFSGRLDPTQRGLIALSEARSCEAKRSVVETLGREGDARAIAPLRRIPIGSGCGFLGLGTCNPCLSAAVPSAIRAIEARSPDAG